MRVDADLTIIWVNAKGKIETETAFTDFDGRIRSMRSLLGHPPSFDHLPHGVITIRGEGCRFLEAVPCRRERGAITRWTKQLEKEKAAKTKSRSKSPRKSAARP